MLLADEYADWTPAGAWAMAELLEELEERVGGPVVLDIVAVRCEFNEYGSIEEVEATYSIPKDYDSLEWLKERTILWEFDSGLILGEF